MPLRKLPRDFWRRPLAKASRSVVDALLEDARRAGAIVDEIAEVAGVEGDRLTLNPLFDGRGGDLRWLGGGEAAVAPGTRASSLVAIGAIVILAIAAVALTIALVVK